MEVSVEFEDHLISIQCCVRSSFTGVSHMKNRNILRFLISLKNIEIEHTQDLILSALACSPELVAEYVFSVLSIDYFI